MCWYYEIHSFSHHVQLFNRLLCLFQENRLDICCFVRGSKKDVVQNNGALYKLFEAVYVPVLLNKWVRPLVVVTFFAWICSSLAVIPHIDVGLDQEQTFPDDSPVQKYFSVSILLSIHKFVNCFNYLFQTNCIFLCST